MGLFSFLKPAPYLPEIQDPEEVKKDYNYWRIRVFYSMFMGYAFFYLTRKSLTYAVPTLMKELSFDKAQIGLLASTWAIAYGFSKFISGIIVLVAGSTDMPKPEILGTLSKWAIVLFAFIIFMEELGLSSLLEGTHFNYLFGALCLALALSFGLGGRDSAAKFLDKLKK